MVFENIGCSFGFIICAQSGNKEKPQPSNYYIVVNSSFPYNLCFDFSTPLGPNYTLLFFKRKTEKICSFRQAVLKENLFKKRVQSKRCVETPNRDSQHACYLPYHFFPNLRIDG